MSFRLISVNNHQISKNLQYHIKIFSHQRTPWLYISHKNGIIYTENEKTKIHSHAFRDATMIMR